MRRLVVILMSASALAGCEHGRSFLSEVPPPAAAPCTPQVQPEQGGPEPLPGFGCATLANLRAMAADPRDLEVGRPESLDKGDAALAAIERYRAGAVKPLKGQDSGQAPSLVIQNQGAPQ